MPWGGVSGMSRADMTASKSWAEPAAMVSSTPSLGVTTNSYSIPARPAMRSMSALLKPVTSPNGSKSAKGGSGASVATTSKSLAASTGRSAVGCAASVGATVASAVTGSASPPQATKAGSAANTSRAIIHLRNDIGNLIERPNLNRLPSITRGDEPASEA